MRSAVVSGNYSPSSSRRHAPLVHSIHRYRRTSFSLSVPSDPSDTSPELPLFFSLRISLSIPSRFSPLLSPAASASRSVATSLFNRPAFSLLSLSLSLSCPCFSRMSFPNLRVSLYPSLRGCHPSLSPSVDSHPRATRDSPRLSPS